MADNLITQDLDLSIPLPFITSNNELNHNNHPLPLPTNDTSTTDKTSHFQPPNGNGSRTEERNSATPVVSWLSIDQQQEKDYLSMRGGRRRKSGPPPIARNSHPFMTNGFNTYPMGFHHPHTYNSFGNGMEFRRPNGVDARNRTKVRTRAYDKRSNEHSSRSSLRTDSNSSASCVDENRNEALTGVNTPPPAPYSPMTPHMKILHNSVSREFHNIARYATSYRPPYHHNNNNNNINDKGRAATVDSAKNNCSSSSGSSTVSRPISPHSSVSQVHVTSSQSFAPQARRSRRSIRRSGPSGVSEIGAGDAPLPNDDVCKKFETLKL